jgi:hypothetical protein
MELLNAMALRELDEGREIWLSLKNRHELDLILGGLMKLLSEYGVNFDVDKLLQADTSMAEAMVEDEAGRTLGAGFLANFRLEVLHERRDFLLDRQSAVESLGFKEDNSDSLTELTDITYNLWQL